MPRSSETCWSEVDRGRKFTGDIIGRRCPSRRMLFWRSCPNLLTWIGFRDQQLLVGIFGRLCLVNFANGCDSFGFGSSLWVCSGAAAQGFSDGSEIVRFRQLTGGMFKSRYPAFLSESGFVPVRHLTEGMFGSLWLDLMR